VARHRFRQVDVFGSVPLLGNPVAVVHEADGVADVTMQRIAQWTNLSETTFLTSPSDPGADYAVRIFTTARELPFAGHPTLGSAHAWLEAGGALRRPDHVVQECGIGLVTLRRTSEGLAFAAPPLLRSGPPDDELQARVLAAMHLDPATVVAVEWVDNGPGWLGVLLDSAASVLAVRASFLDCPIGLVGPHPAGAPAQFEVRALFPSNGTILEDPVTGSLNASLALWLLASGHARAPYVATQGAGIGRSGRVHVSQDPDGTTWIGGATTTIVEGSLEITSTDGR
jgi:PhzF family phenazine biosynthesis protein